VADDRRRGRLNDKKESSLTRDTNHAAPCKLLARCPVPLDLSHGQAADLRWLRLSGNTSELVASLPLDLSHLATATRLVGGSSTLPPAEHHVLDRAVAVPQVTGSDRNLRGNRISLRMAVTAQIRWRRPADGSEAMAIAQIRWHTTETQRDHASPAPGAGLMKDAVPAVVPVVEVDAVFAVAAARSPSHTRSPRPASHVGSPAKSPKTEHAT
jgi:hypothetical protein